MIVGIVVEELKIGNNDGSGTSVGILSAPGERVRSPTLGALEGLSCPRRNDGRLVAPGAREGFG